jgi:hypothetical protein
LERAVPQVFNRTSICLGEQDALTPESVLLLGFIAEITGSREQDALAKTLFRL